METERSKPMRLGGTFQVQTVTGNHTGVNGPQELLKVALIEKHNSHHKGNKRSFILQNIYIFRLLYILFSNLEEFGENFVVTQQ